MEKIDIVLYVRRATAYDDLFKTVLEIFGNLVVGIGYLKRLDELGARFPGLI